MTDQKLKLNLNFYTLYTFSSLLFVVFYRLIIFNINNVCFFYRWLDGRGCNIYILK